MKWLAAAAGWAAIIFSLWCILLCAGAAVRAVSMLRHAKKDG